MSLNKLAHFVDALLQSQILDAQQCDEVVRLKQTAEHARTLAQELLRRDWLTAFQINQIFQGKGADLTLGPYILVERLGVGGMGQVYKARQKMLNRLVALKVIRKDCLDNPKSILRFLREIRAASQLSHPNIVRAYDADEVNGVHYFAMELIDGVDLARLVKDNGPLRVDRACEYIRQAALGLQHAHERGMVHRDIKPANLLVARGIASDRRRSSGYIPRPLLNAKASGAALARPETLECRWGVIKILDMGLARCSDPFTGRSGTHLTQIGSVMGTPEYIAPEQALDSHRSDIRADLYSLGCTFYFLLTGQPPFPTGTLTEKLLQQQFDQPEPVEKVRRQQLQVWNAETGPAKVSEEMLHVPGPIAEVVRRLMCKRPPDRYQTPQELADVLQGLLKQLGEGSLTPEPVPAARPAAGADKAETVLLAAAPIAADAAPMLALDTLNTQIQPIVRLSSARTQGRSELPVMPLTVASLAAVVVLGFTMTVIAAFVGQSQRTQAGDAVDPKVKNVAKNP